MNFVYRRKLLETLLLHSDAEQALREFKEFKLIRGVHLFYDAWKKVSQQTYARS